LSWVEIDENVEVGFTPRPLTTAMIATEIPGSDEPVFDGDGSRFVLEKGECEILHWKLPSSRRAGPKRFLPEPSKCRLLVKTAHPAGFAKLMVCGF
jgi:hypothetical protein